MKFETAATNTKQQRKNDCYSWFDGPFFTGQLYHKNMSNMKLSMEWAVKSAHNYDVAILNNTSQTDSYNK